MKCVLAVILLYVVIVDSMNLRNSKPECSQSSLRKKCAASDDYKMCVLASCASCINESPYNPIVLFCPRLVSCTCSVLQEVGCVELAATACPKDEDSK